MTGLSSFYDGDDGVYGAFLRPIGRRCDGDDGHVSCHLDLDRFVRYAYALARDSKDRHILGHRRSCLVGGKCLNLGVWGLSKRGCG